MKEKEFCKCKTSSSVYSVDGDFGYWLYCDDCNKPIEDEFHYYDEPELY